jgi:DNA modification methylase
LSGSQNWKLFCGDAATVLRGLEDESVNCVVTSPPYWMLRDYDVEGQLGLEEDPNDYIDKMVLVFHEAQRVIKKEGTLWVNIGDTYAAGVRGGDCDFIERRWKKPSKANGCRSPLTGLKCKDIVGIPWMLAFALRADGWYWRSKIVWHKPNAMPEGRLDRPSIDHDDIFLFSRSPKYFYDREAVKEKARGTAHARGCGVNPKAKDHNRLQKPRTRQNTSFSAAVTDIVDTRNIRTVWTIPTQPYSDDHHAAFPEEIPRRCILAGCPNGGVVLDPFCGRGTTGVVAVQRGRRFIGIDINQQYIELSEKNIREAERQLPLKGIGDI